MATSQSTIDYLLDQLTGSGDFTARKMFGEYCVYLSGKPIALVCDDRLYLKPTAAADRLIPDPVRESPFPKAKLHILIDVGLWEDRDWLAKILVATAAELPAPKPKKK